MISKRFSFAIITISFLALFFFRPDLLGTHWGKGTIQGGALPPQWIEAQQKAIASAATQPIEQQILFGDLHVHTTFSDDAVLQSLPVVGGAGVHPPADACDFARYCSALDFWSINDHASSLTPEHWQETIDSVRQCNAVAGDTANPDMVTFLGWEWTNIGATPDTHYGHKNVVIKGIGPDDIPIRPIASPSQSAKKDLLGSQPGWKKSLLALSQWDSHYLNWAKLIHEIAAVEPCPEGDVRSLPTNCREYAPTPKHLFTKLDQWGLDSIVIPHGTTWGVYTPQGASWEKQLEDHDPKREILFEIYSGHGGTEAYFDFRSVAFDDAGKPYCPPSQKNYQPGCQRAGEIIFQRCQQRGELSQQQCQLHADEARQLFVEAPGPLGWAVIPDAIAQDWGWSEQCLDCQQPAYNYRPLGSAQAVLAMRKASDSGKPKAFQFGFIGSSDTHRAKPGTGYKEFGKGEMSDGGRPGFRQQRQKVDPTNAVTKAIPALEAIKANPKLSSALYDRVASFLYSGGLVAVHADSRSRDDIWQAFQNKQVYATSGPKILLWFDWVQQAGITKAMGSTITTSNKPTFSAKAVGSFEQLPGCPDHVSNALGQDRLQQLCLGECYNPSPRRKLITRIDVVKIRPQNHSDESLSDLIEDPWLSIDCPPNPDGCEIEFSDNDYEGELRDSVYYVRAYETSGPAINGSSMHCDQSAGNNCETISVCDEDADNPDCLSPVEETAWSSPIYLSYGKSETLIGVR